MTRISRHQMFMQMARVASQRSTCSRLNVGAVIVSHDNRIVSIGYNGTPAGQPHCIGNECPGRQECTLTTHAEVNALDYVPRGVQPAILYVTHSPCWRCVKAIQDSLVVATIFEIPYRKTDHLPLLGNVYQLTPAGYLVRWADQRIVESI